MCFRFSKEPSHRDRSFEYPQHMFWLLNNKNNFQLHTLIWGVWNSAYCSEMPHSTTLHLGPHCFVTISFNSFPWKPITKKLRAVNTLDRRESKMLSIIDERGSKIDRNSVFICHLLPVGPQMTIENSVSIDFWSMFLDSIGVFDCRLHGVVNAIWIHSLVRAFTVLCIYGTYLHWCIFLE